MINHNNLIVLLSSADFSGAYEETQEGRRRRLGPEESSGRRECQKHPWGQNGQCQRHVIENASGLLKALNVSLKCFDQSTITSFEEYNRTTNYFAGA